MEPRKQYWYSIIKYIADFTKGEPLNVGILLESSEDNKINYILLEDSNPKLKCIFENDLQKSTYKFGRDYFEYFLKVVSDGTYPATIQIKNSSMLSFLIGSDELPKGFLISEPQFAKTENRKMLFNNLQISYIGAKFLNVGSVPRELLVKERVNTIFTEANLINEKIKANIKISPSPSLPFKYQVDFAYRFDDSVGLVQAAPGKADLLPDWLEKLNLISTKYNKAGKIALMFDSSVDSNLLSDTKSVIRVLQSGDSKVSAFDINNSNELPKFIAGIKEQAKSVDSLEDLIAV